MTTYTEYDRQNQHATSHSGDDYETGSDRIEETSGELKQQAAETADQVKAKASEVTAQVKDQAGQTAEKAVQQVKSVAAERKEQAASTLSNISQALYSASENMWDQDQTIAQYTQQAAEQVDRLTGYLHDRSVNEVIADVEDFSRRRPELFLGAAFLLGVAAARFIKSSQSALESHVSYAPRQGDAGYQSSTSQPRNTGGYGAWDAAHQSQGQ